MDVYAGHQACTNERDGNDFINMFSHFTDENGGVTETESKALPGLGTCSSVEPFGFVHHKPGQKLHKSEFP